MRERVGEKTNSWMKSALRIHIRWIQNTDPGFEKFKIERFYSRKKFLIKKSKSANYLLLASMQGFKLPVQKKPSALKREQSALHKHEISSLLFLRCGGGGGNHLSLVGYGKDPTEARSKSPSETL